MPGWRNCWPRDSKSWTGAGRSLPSSFVPGPSINRRPLPAGRPPGAGGGPTWPASASGRGERPAGGANRSVTRSSREFARARVAGGETVGAEPLSGPGGSAAEAVSGKPGVSHQCRLGRSHARRTARRGARKDAPLAVARAGILSGMDERLEAAPGQRTGRRYGQKAASSAQRVASSKYLAQRATTSGNSSAKSCCSAGSFSRS